MFIKLAPRNLIVFVHIPKTAGITLSTLLAQQYSPEQRYSIHQNGSTKQILRFRSALRQRRDTLRLVHGHLDLSLAKWLPPDARFFTFLRDPVERAISHYYQYRRASRDPIHPLAMQSTLEQWVSSRGLKEMDNGQTRRLAGQVDLPVGAVSEKTLARAKANLAKFALVGLTERFEESQILLHHEFGWPLYRCSARNVGDNRLRRHEVDAEALAIIESCNRFDMELYRHATELFESGAAKLDMAIELAALKAAPEYVEPPRIAAEATPAEPARRRFAHWLGTHFGNGRS